jgi:hypothetical protein
VAWHGLLLESLRLELFANLLPEGGREESHLAATASRFLMFARIAESRHARAESDFAGDVP